MLDQSLPRPDSNQYESICHDNYISLITNKKTWNCDLFSIYDKPRGIEHDTLGYDHGLVKIC